MIRMEAPTAYVVTSMDPLSSGLYPVVTTQCSFDGPMRWSKYLTSAWTRNSKAKRFLTGGAVIF
jgi:hypothetical protein